MDTGGLALKAKKYASIKYALIIAGTLYLVAIILIFLWSGGSRFLAQRILKFTARTYVVIPVYLAVVSAAYYLLNLPLHFYGTYTLEHKFGLSHQKITDWLKDEAKSGVISYLIAVILIGALYFFIRFFFHAWWLVVSLFWIFFSVLLAKLTPVLIIPLFFKYKRLSDETMRGRISGLADKMQVKIMDCFEIDFSKNTVKANAAFAGWGATRRVILADTLKDKYDYDEIEVILAHEFAHYKLKHMPKLIALNSAFIMLCCYGVFLTSDNFLKVFGLSSLWDISALPVILLYFIFLGIILQPLENLISRKLERDADMLALKTTGLKAAFISLMDKLSIQNLSDRNPSRLVKIYFFDHPPIDERIAMAQSYQA